VPRLGLEVDGAPLSVGVGIATGLAYVGNIHSANRVIWGGTRPEDFVPTR